MQKKRQKFIINKTEKSVLEWKGEANQSKPNHGSMISVIKIKLNNKMLIYKLALYVVIFSTFFVGSNVR
jgi:hypothetical protein